MFPFVFNNITGIYRFYAVPEIEEKLKKSDCSLEELLDDDGIIQEMKINQNNKLVNFFDKHNVKKLVNYIITEPEVDDHKRGYKYPFISSEILNCDVSKINEFFILTDLEYELAKRKEMSNSYDDSDVILCSYDHINAFSNENQKKSMNDQLDKEEKTSISQIIHEEKVFFNTESQGKHKHRIELLDYLLSFVETDTELNFVLAGYFSKLLNFLLNKYLHKMISYIYLSRPEILKKLIYHCEKKSIADLISKLLQIENVSTERISNLSHTEYSNEFSLNFVTITTIKNSIIHQLFKTLNINDKNIEKIANIASICCELIEHKSTLELVLADYDLLDHITSSLAFNIQDINSKEFYFIYFNYDEILNLLVNIIMFSQIESSNDGIEESYKFENYEGNVESLSLLGRSILKNLEKILSNFLPNDIAENQLIDGTFGKNFKPLGRRRVKLVEFAYSLLTYFKNSPSILDTILIKSNFVKYLVQYFFQNEWNNMYQLKFENFFKCYFSNIRSHEELTRYLFMELNLLNIFMEHGVSCTVKSEKELDTGFVFSSNRKINHGYIAILVEVCYKIYQCQISHPDLMEKFPNAEWDNYVQNKVMVWKKLFDRSLCGPDAPISDGHFNQYDKTFEELNKIETDYDENKEEDFTAENNAEQVNPFLSKNDERFFNMMNNDDNWFTTENSDKLRAENENDNDLEAFDFLEYKKKERKSSQEEELLKEKDICNLKVDEIEVENYCDTNFWNRLKLNVLTQKNLEYIIRDLEL